MVVTKRRLGTNYLTGTGIILSGLFLLYMAIGLPTTGELILGLVGFFAAVLITSTYFWMDVFDMNGDQIWRVAIHAGLGIGLLTFSNLLTLQISRLGIGPGSTYPVLISSSIALGGAGGAGVGLFREFNRSTTTLSQSTEVLTRVLRHDVRNNMTVVLGHLEKLEESGDQRVRYHSQIVQSKIDDVVRLSEKAQQVERAVNYDERRNRPVDIAASIRRQVGVFRSDHPDAEIRMHIPGTAWVKADWMIEIALEYLLENAVPSSDGNTEIEISLAHFAVFWTDIRVVDANGTFSQADLDTLESGTETPLQHGNGLDLWLVYWIVKSCGGNLHVAHEDGSAEITFRLRRKWPIGHLRRFLEKSPASD